MKYLFYAAGLLAISTPAYAESWRAASLGKTAVEFVDSGSVSRSGDMVTFRTLILPSAPLAGNVNRVIQTKQVNCSAWTIKRVDGTYYNGSTVVMRDPAGGEKSMTSGSVNDGIGKTVCGQRDYLSGTLSDPAVYAANHFATVRASGQ